MEYTSMIIGMVATIVVGIISYFLKKTIETSEKNNIELLSKIEKYNDKFSGVIEDLDRRFREENQRVKDEGGKLRGKIDLLNQQRENDLQKIQTETQLKMDYLQEKLDTMNTNLIALSEDMKLILQEMAKGRK